MSLPPLPIYTIAGPLGTGSYFNGHTDAAMQAHGQACYEKALLDAMNATLPFGKTGAVIAAAIGALK